MRGYGVCCCSRECRNRNLTRLAAGTLSLWERETDEQRGNAMNSARSEISAIAKPSPLGRGLSALFGDADASYQAPAACAAVPPWQRRVPPGANGGMQKLPVAWLKSGMFQPRRHFRRRRTLKELADSIRERGILDAASLVRPAMPEGDTRICLKSSPANAAGAPRKWRDCMKCR